jgi:pyruvate dehydrogenase E2 component (dihydrolipoamide acetyltransferase)
MTNRMDLTVPDIGDFRDVPIVEIAVSLGDVIAADDTLVILESDKATLDVPAAVGGRIVALHVAPGDRVAEGSRIATVETDAAEGAVVAAPPVEAAPPPPPPPPPPPSAPAPVAEERRLIHASPSIRKLARELGVDLSALAGTGPKGRITREDVHGFVKGVLSAPPGRGQAVGTSGLGLDLPPWPQVDYARFGPVERVPLSRIVRISGPNLARNALVIPHVTNFDEADITDLEAFRARINAEGGVGVKLSILPFVVKAAVAALKAFPKVNSSLDGDALVLKAYYNIGVAADTPDGLVVPVIKEADKKGIAEIAEEMAALAVAAREGRLSPGDMQGATFTISSLGGIGGTNFTPIINAPEVAILGMTRSDIKPVWDGSAFQPRRIQPMSLSWDHRVIDGVAAARFLAHMKATLSDFQRATL